jgi:tetratricopeptide (TPR) repeat protein
MTLTSKEQNNIFNKLWKEGKLIEVRNHLFEWLKEIPEDAWDSHWLIAQIAETYYIQKSFNEALEYSEKAWKIAPRCPLVLWEYSESLLRLGRDSEAEPLYRNIIRRGVKRIAYGECGEGIRQARMLVNDCRYALGLIYANKNEFILAKEYIQIYIVHRDVNCASLFQLREAKKDLAQILQGKKPICF